MDITFNVIDKKEIIVIYFEGSLEIEDISILDKRIKDILGLKPYKKIIFNFSKLNYMNSSALNKFILVYNSLLKDGYKIVFCNLSKSVETLFSITSLNIILSIYSNEWDAINSFE
jgi:anti-anti-sigma factor